MVAQIDPISTPPTPADTPAVFEEKASQVWADLHRAVPQMNQQAQETNTAAESAEQAKVRAIAESDAALAYRNEAGASKTAATEHAASALASRQASDAAKVAAEAARDAAAMSAASIDPVELRKRENHTGKQGVETIEGLGTAAIADVTTSRTDTTASRVVRVGDFGWGGPSVVDQNANAPRAPGVYGFQEAANAPYATVNLISMDWGPDPRWQTQFAIGVNANRAFIRSILKDQAVSTNWVELFHTGNFDPASKSNVGHAHGVVTSSATVEFAAPGNSTADLPDGYVVTGLRTTSSSSGYTNLWIRAKTLATS